MTTTGLELPDRTGIVLIGRNEGERLRRGLDRLGPQPRRAVYVDSGSSDESVSVARARRWAVLELDDRAPFTAARARNEGLSFLLREWPDVEYVQFVDGDCILAPGWLEAGTRALDDDPALGLVTGILREADPARSVYHRLCDLEWGGPLGDIEKCGGNAMIRRAAYRDAGGMNPTLIAGEETDLHLRMRAKGWKLRRIDRLMAHHQADVTQFRQWWARSLRYGQACAQWELSSDLPCDPDTRRNIRSNWVWGLGVPAIATALAPATMTGSLAIGAAGYLALYVKVIRRKLAAGLSFTDAELYARFTVLGKLPHAIGQTRYHLGRLRGSPVRLRDHKHRTNPSSRGLARAASLA